MSLLQILLALPQLIHAVENLFSAFHGQGPIKKDIVQGAVGSVIDIANSLGLAKIDKANTLVTTGALVDDYVAVTNATQSWGSGG